MITIEHHADPGLSSNWPHPESVWKDKEFVLAARPSKATRIPRFAEIARWAPSSTLPPLWTTFGGEEWKANDGSSAAVEEKLEDTQEEDLKRMRWEIETDV
ncbi:hypothetical protein GALMADRAFT_256465 [Galerina marginata CBS 339.88]|uniref:Uncharacterized protein n=1 Tax=Galerina marginata (strain CBS 339.88) TaxID=685588 RepID=A0A067SCM0_GALM3|nr:hypothetical protein GALMADRAFT_256465 [Galerina marginata CBS 339.88]